MPPDRAAEEDRAARTTYLVVNMMRSVLNEGTGAAARAGGFALDAAGKTGTTNDSARRLVRRLHAGAADRGLGRASTTTSRSA